MQSNVIKQASVADLDLIVPLFDAYRQFYGLASDEVVCRHYLSARLAHQESVIFFCAAGELASGFTQMYPSFSSLSAKKTWVLYDLYVMPQARGQHVADSLMAAAESFARQSGASSISLETAKSNMAAQSLYERRGYLRDNEFYSYSLDLLKQ